ncbi:MAG: lipid-A-disaccharide synthase [Alphaproteobacteria bacterium]|nr:lipid-A-disaccharide synthase [Alphaproteobacteria bacterium]
MAKKIFLIAGEASGDVLGASMMRAMKAQSSEPLEFIGIGGPLMEAQGLSSLLPMSELCVMGLWEVLWQLPRLLKLINGVIEEIEAAQPDLLITIDLPDFNFEVVKRLRKRASVSCKMVHYVSPSVWAWRAGRAKKVAALYDKILCLLPFEPPYYEGLETSAVFVGHPLVEAAQGYDAQKFRAENNITPDDTVLGLFFGSRERELLTHAPIFKEAVRVLKEQYPDLKILVPTLPNFEFNVRKALEDWEFETIIVSSPDLKWDSFAACDLAIAVSGTVGLELAYIGVPHVIAYKMHPATAFLAKRLIKVKYAHLANILLDKPAVPECLQSQCNALDVAKEALRLLKDQEKRSGQVQALQSLEGLLKPADASPAQKAAQETLGLL